MIDHNYIAAKTFLNLLSDAQKIKLCQQTLAGVEDKKIDSKQRIKDFIKYFDKK